MITKLIHSVHRFIHFTFLPLCAIGFFILLPAHAFAASAQILDGEYEASTSTNFLSPTGIAQVNSMMSAVCLGGVSCSIYWTGTFEAPPYDNTTDPPIDWVHGGSYNGDFTSGVDIRIGSDSIPSGGGSEISGHDDLYECINEVLVGGSTFRKPGAYGQDDLCMHYQWNSTDGKYEVQPSGVAPETSCVTGKSCILTVTPANASTVATSSTPIIGSTGTVTTGDFKTGSRIQIKIDRDTDSQGISPLLAFESAFGNITTLPIISSGNYDVSTTTIVNTLGINRVGRYHMTQTLQSPGFGIHFLFIDWDITFNTLDTKTTTFIVGTTTSIDKITGGSGGILSDLNGNTADILSDCQFNWFSSAVDFSLGSKLMTCMGGITTYFFVPSGDDIKNNIALFRTNVLDRWPWGYATRTVSIFADASSTADIPVVTAPIYLTGTSTPDTTLSFDTQDMLDGGAALAMSVKANGTNQNIEDITKPWIELFLALSIVIIIFHDLMGMAHHTKHTGAQSSSNKRN